MRKLFAFLFLCVALSPLHAETFQNPRRIPTTYTPDLILHADINHDGAEDLIYGENTGVLHILLGTGAGAFQPSSNLILPVNVFDSCLAGDFNGDGLVDLACNYDYTFQASMVFFAGKGDGTFAAPIYVPLPNGSNYFNLRLQSTGDMNGDGVPDMMAIDNGDEYSFPILSDGHGGFKVGPRLSYVGVGNFLDVNGDGKADLLTSGPTVYLGNGDGTFRQLQANSSVNYQNQGCLWGDLDSDGIPDVACYGIGEYGGDINGTGHLVIFHGHSDGTLDSQPEWTLNVGSTTGAEYEGYGTLGGVIAIADMNGDATNDIVLNAPDGITVLYNNGPLSFTNPVHFAAGVYSTGTSFVANVDGGGLPDVVASGPQSVLVTPARRDSTLTTARAYELTGVIGYTAVADFNGDGVPDAVATGDFYLALSLGKGDGSFQPFIKVPTGPVHFEGLYQHANAGVVISGDFNGDGKQDLLARGAEDSGSFTPYIYFIQGNGDGTFALPVRTSLPAGPFSPGMPNTCDLNGDGRSDVFFPPVTTLATESTITVYLATASGSFVSKTSTVPVETFISGFYNYPEVLPAAADFDGDGKLDLVTAARANAYVLKGNGDGTFSATAKLPIPAFGSDMQYQADAIATGDFDGDGKQDIAVLWGANVNGGFPTHAITHEVVIFYGNGDATFSSPVVVDQTSNDYVLMTAADLNGDGRTDLILNSTGTLGGGTAISVIHGLANRTFSTETPYTAGNGLSNIAVADFNRDGLPDLLFTNDDYNIPANSATILLNLGNTPVVTGSLRATPEPSTVGSPFSLIAALVSPDGSALTGNVSFTLDGTSVGSTALVGNSATLTVPSSITSTLAVGAHTLGATWPGNTTFAAVNLGGTHTVVGLPTSLSLTSSSPTANAGDNTLFTSTLSTTSMANLPAGGTLTLADNGSVIHTTPLSSVTLPLTNTFSTASLSRGTHSLTAQYSGDGVYAPATATLTQTVNGIANSMSLGASPSPAFVAQTVLLTAQLQPASNCAACIYSGTVQFLDGSAPLGAATLSSTGVATLQVTFAMAGTHSLSVTFAGDDFHLPASATVSETVLRTGTALSLTSSPNPSVSGQTVRFNAFLTTTTSNAPIGSGTIVFSIDGGAATSSALDSTGHAALDLASLHAGSHTITASFAETASLIASSATLPQTVVRADTATTLAIVGGTIYQSTPTTLTATVISATGIAPTGPVTFYEGAVALGTATISKGIAMLTVRFSTAGAQGIYAAYGGDSETNPSQSANTTLVVLPSDFQITQSGSLTVRTEHNIRFNVGAQSIGAFSDDLHFSVSGLPNHMHVIFTPDHGSLAIGGTMSISAYLDTDDVLGFRSAVEPPTRLRSVPLGLTTFALLFPINAGLLALRRRKSVRLLTTAFLAILLFNATGCGDKYPAATPPGSYTVHLAATGSATGLTHTMDLNINVTP